MDTTIAPTQHCDDCKVGPFFYVPTRSYPELCIDCSDRADRSEVGWSPTNSVN